MATSLAFLFFGTLAVAAIVSMAKIQRQETRCKREGRLAALDAQRKREAQLEAFRGKCYRPDGD